jgi:hypothetical protein
VSSPAAAAEVSHSTGLRVLNRGNPDNPDNPMRWIMPASVSGAWGFQLVEAWCSVPGARWESRPGPQDRSNPGSAVSQSLVARAMRP